MADDGGNNGDVVRSAAVTCDDVHQLRKRATTALIRLTNGHQAQLRHSSSDVHLRKRKRVTATTGRISYPQQSPLRTIASPLLLLFLILGGAIQLLDNGSILLASAQSTETPPTESITTTIVSSPDELKMAMVPKFGGVLVFDQANQGAQRAYQELGGPGILLYEPPDTPADSGAAQIDFLDRATLAGFFNTILLSNNADNDIAPAALEATRQGVNVVTWDSPIPSGQEGGEQIFVAQVDFDRTGTVMADMALGILGENRGDGTKKKIAILSASPKAANQNAWIASMEQVMASDPDKYGHLEVVDIVYGDDVADLSFQQANYLLDTYPDLDLIISPTTIGIVEAAKAVTERNLCDSVKVSGLGLPSEMIQYTLSGCAPQFALWSFVDLGYLTYYTAYRLATGTLEVKDGATYNAGRLGTKVVERDPTRPGVEAYRVIMDDFTMYDKTNIERAVLDSALQDDPLGGQQETFEQKYIEKYKKKAIAIIPKVTGMISCFFSGYIIWHVLRSPRRRKLTKNRLLVGISVHDMIGSFFGFFLSTWPIPADTWLVYGAVGTTQSCTMQGFFFQGGIGAAPLYSAALTTFYLLNVVFEWNTDKIVKFAEPWLHGIPIVFAWGTAIAGLPLKLYNAADRVGFMCWIAEYPAYCSLRDTCERGLHANDFRWAFLYAWVFAVFIYMAACMSLIYYRVLSAERATDRWTQASGQRRRRNLSRKVSDSVQFDLSFEPDLWVAVKSRFVSVQFLLSFLATSSTQVACQGLQYVVAFIFPWIFGITVSVIQNTTYGNLSASAQLDSAMTSLEIVNALIWPLKGFFTFLAYVRPKPKDGRRGSTDGRTSSDGQRSRPNTRSRSRESNASAEGRGGDGTAGDDGQPSGSKKLSIISFITRSVLQRDHNRSTQAESRNSAYDSQEDFSKSLEFEGIKEGGAGGAGDGVPNGNGDSAMETNPGSSDVRSSGGLMSTDDFVTRSLLVRELTPQSPWESSLPPSAEVEESEENLLGASASSIHSRPAAAIAGLEDLYADVSSRSAQAEEDLLGASASSIHSRPAAAIAGLEDLYADVSSKS